MKRQSSLTSPIVHSQTISKVKEYQTFVASFILNFNNALIFTTHEGNISKGTKRKAHRVHLIKKSNKKIRASYNGHILKHLKLVYIYVYMNTKKYNFNIKN